MITGGPVESSRRVGDTPATLADGRRVAAWIPVVVLVFALVLQAAFVVALDKSRPALDHDEIISQMVASGHLDTWPENGRTPPAGTWVTSGDIRRFLALDGHSSIAQVRRNLAQDDVHPPMYFWALLGAREAGLGLRWSGVILNIVFAGLASVLLFFLLVEVLRDRLLAALAVLIFALSPALLRATAFSRQYPLLMLAGVALIWVTARLQQRPLSIPYLAAFAGIAAFGVLTDTVFAFAVLGAVLVVIGRRFRERDAIARILVATAVGGVVVYVIFPSYPAQLSRLDAIVAGTNTAGFATRVHDWVLGLYDYVSVETSSHAIVTAVVVLGLLAALVTVPLWWRRAWNVVRRQPVGVAALGIGGVTLAAQTVAYVLNRTPSYAAGWQYIILFWPAIVLLLVTLVRNVARRALLFAFVLAAAILGVSALHWERAAHADYGAERRAVKEIAHATVVVSDCLPRGYSAGVAMWPPRGTPFLLVAPGRGSMPALPSGTDRSRPFLLLGGTCAPTRDAHEVATSLGFTLGRRVGPIGFVDVYRLQP